jgi:plasmid stabilization system protein ParE
VAKLIWTNESERWLKDIFNYIAQDNPIAAESVVSGIYEKAQQLIQFPESGYKYEGNNRDVRILLYGHYRIAYIVADDQIIVLGVFHGALAIDRYLI